MLTAAHCAVVGNASPLDPSAFAVTIGNTVLSDAGPNHRYPVADALVHPNYDPFGHGVDAVLTRAEPVTSVEPSGLIAVGSSVRPGTRSRVAGWGYRSSASPAAHPTACAHRPRESPP